MTPRVLGAVLVCGAVTVPAAAQLGAWVVEIIGDSNGDGLFEPGEVPTARLSVDMDPSVDQKSGDAYVAGFYAAVFDVRGTSQWATGQVSWQVFEPLLFLTGDLTVKDDATQDLFGVTAAQPGIGGGGPWTVQDDPIEIIQITWDPGTDYTPRTVSARTDLAPLDSFGVEKIGIWVGALPDTTDDIQLWDLPDVEFSFRIVPSPGAAGVLALTFGAVAVRRRRWAHRGH